MNAKLYDPDFIARYFDDFAEREWTRLVNTPADEVKLYVHSHYLEHYIENSMRVLDIGAGAGRFTQVLAKLGASVVVADISPRQIELNKQFARELNFAHAIEDWMQLDMCDMHVFTDHTFDAVVCYGNPLGYVFEKRDAAFREVLRVLKPGGKAFISVASLWGSAHELLPAVLTIDREQNSEILRTGDLYFDSSEGLRHRCHMFRSQEFREFLQEHGVQILRYSASNCLSAVWGEKLRDIRADQTRWDELLNMELEATQQPGCLDMGTHLLAVIEKPAQG